jgi:hypothetical protein
VQVQHDKVVIGFDPEFAAKRDAIDHPRNVQAVQKVLGDILKRPVSVSFTVLGSESARSMPADKPAAPQPGKNEGPESRKSRQQWTQDPAVKRALETFNGDIIDIRE